METIYNYFTVFRVSFQYSHLTRESDSFHVQTYPIDLSILPAIGAHPDLFRARDGVTDFSRGIEFYQRPRSTEGSLWRKVKGTRLFR